MTTYNKRAEISKTRARMQTIAQAGVFHPDPGPAAGFARECLARVPRAGDALQSMTIPGAADVGILALALAGLALRSLRESVGAGATEGSEGSENSAGSATSSRINSEAGLNAVLALFHLTLPLDVRKLNGALNELMRLAPVYRGYVCAQERAQIERDARARKMKQVQQGRQQGRGKDLSEDIDCVSSDPAAPEVPLHGESLFSRDLARFQFGFDGHWMTRETAARLRLVRYYEKASSDFSRFVRRAWGLLSQQGAAYMAWQSNFPILVCDLNIPAHREAALVLFEACHGEAVVVTPGFDARLRAAFPSALLVVEDNTQAFAAIAGNYGVVMLLEKRIGGWTVTFPAGAVAPRELTKTRYGKLPVALAMCHPQNAVHFETVAKNREKKAQRKSPRNQRPTKSSTHSQSQSPTQGPTRTHPQSPQSMSSVSSMSSMSTPEVRA